MRAEDSKLAEIALRAYVNDECVQEVLLVVMTSDLLMFPMMYQEAKKALVFALVRKRINVYDATIKAELPTGELLKFPNADKEMGMNDKWDLWELAMKQELMYESPVFDQLLDLPVRR